MSVIKFCNRCGAPVKKGIPPGDTLQRHICENCNHIQYENPRLIVGCLPFWEDNRVLLCRRAIEPRYGLWTLPCGFMENGEDIEEGARRETAEEANARVDILNLHTVFSLPRLNQVHFIFLARLQDTNFSPGEESIETLLFTRDNIPWQEIAFSSTRFALENFFDENRNEGAVHLGSGERLGP